MSKEFKILDRNKVEVPNGGVVKFIDSDNEYQVLVSISNIWYLQNINSDVMTLFELNNFDIEIDYKEKIIQLSNLVFTDILSGKVIDKVNGLWKK